MDIWLPYFPRNLRDTHVNSVTWKQGKNNNREFRTINVVSPRDWRVIPALRSNGHSRSLCNCRLFHDSWCQLERQVSTQNCAGWRFPSDFIALTGRSGDYPKFHSPTRRNSRIKWQLIASRRNFGSCGPNLPGAFARNCRNYTEREVLRVWNERKKIVA